MNWLKRIMALIVCVVLSLALAGCGKEEPVEADPNKPYAGTTITVFNWYDYIDEADTHGFSHENSMMLDI